MGIMSLGMKDKWIMDHLQRGGLTFDEVGTQLVAKFIVDAMTDPKIAGACSRFGFDANDLCCIYSVMVESLRPNPLIKSGSRMVAASLPFMEPFRIEAMLSQMSREILPGMSPEDRREVIKRHAEGNARVIWETHTQSRGKAEFQVQPGGKGRPSAGCAGVLFIFALAMGALATAVFLT